MAAAYQGKYTPTNYKNPLQGGLGVLGGDVLAEGTRMGERQEELVDEARKAARAEAIRKNQRTYQEGVLTEERQYKEGKDKEARDRLLDPKSPEGKMQSLKERKLGAEIKLREAQTSAAGRKGTNKDDALSQYTKDGKPLTMAQAKLAMREFQEQDREAVQLAKDAAAGELKKVLDVADKSWFSTDETDAENFIDLYLINPTLAEKKDPKAYKEVEAILGDPRYTIFDNLQSFIDRESTATVSRPTSGVTKSGTKYQKVSK